MFKVLLTGGSTGGHLYPLLAVAEELYAVSREKQIPIQISYIGTRPFRPQDVSHLGIKMQFTEGAKMRSYPSFENVIDAVKMPFEFLSALGKVYGVLPDVVFSKGGPGTLPVIAAAKLLGSRIVIHDSDAVPGRSNLAAERFADTVLVSFPEAAQAFRKDAMVVGNPVSPSLQAAKLAESDFYANGIDHSSETILVLGGSQGAQRINEFLMLVLPELVKKYQVIHQCGEKNYQEMKEMGEFILEREVPYRRGFYKPFGFIDHALLFKLINFAGLVVNRAGGGIFEIAAAGKPSILIPLPKEVAANDHQTKNAYDYAATGAAVILEEPNLKESLFLSVVDGIMSDPQKRTTMSQAALAFAKPDAARKIAEIILAHRK